ncbi:MAG: NAD(P)H-hydrate dehydratase [Saprospiraceae bacterium]|nr:NAD(P)H-hydrate dehydratase [Saprospiraceae bacterium]
MKIFVKNGLKEWDHYTIQHEPVSSLNLMKRAAERLTEKIIPFLDISQPVVILCGPGNNGGDGLCISVLLRDLFYKVEIWYFPIHPPSEENIICMAKVKQTDEISWQNISFETPLPALSPDAIIIDAVMGYGFYGPWKDGWENVISAINHLPNYKIAIDLPSGMNDDEILSSLCVHVNTTLSIEVHKRCFYYSENYVKTGNIQVVPIGLDSTFYKNKKTSYYSIDANYVKSILTPRQTFDQKWQFGHTALMVGHQLSKGAALLAAKACLRSGAGLLTCYIPEVVSDPLVTFLPETMVHLNGTSQLEGKIEIPGYINSYGIGPGLGRSEQTQKAVLELLESTAHISKVIDADALNALSSSGKNPGSYLHNAVITPHEKEFERLFGKQNSMLEMEAKALKICEKYHCVCILKGAFSRVITPEGVLFYNTTGNPGMAKAGSGDVLTGMITGFLSQGYSLENAAVLGVFLHGLSGDLAKEILGEYAMLPSDTIDNIGKSFLMIQ